MNKVRSMELNLVGKILVCNFQLFIGEEPLFFHSLKKKTLYRRHTCIYVSYIQLYSNIKSAKLEQRKHQIGLKPWDS